MLEIVNGVGRDIQHTQLCIGLQTRDLGDCIMRDVEFTKAFEILQARDLGEAIGLE